MRGLLRNLLCGLALFCAASPSVLAGDGWGWYDKARNELVETYDQGDTYLFLPFRIYHMRSAYTQAQIDNYQERPPGLGIGRGRIDDKGNWHGVYAMGFQDSHFMPEWMLGYNWMYGMQLADDARLGIGYAAFLTTRKDYSNYMPTPGIVPTASLQFHRLAIEGCYIPGGKSFGNILFFWAKLRLGT